MGPLSVGALLAGLVSSVAGARANQRASANDYVNQLGVEMQEAAQRTDEARARNAVRDTYRDRNDTYAAANQGELRQALAPYAPGAQTARQAGEEAVRGQAVTNNVAAGDYSAPNLGVFDSPTVANAFRDAIARRVQFAHDGGQRAARVASWGDTWDRNRRDVGDSAGRIGTTNAMARNDMAALPNAQDLAGFQTERIINRPARSDRSVGDLLQSLGGFAGSVAGSGRLDGMTSLFGRSAPEQGQWYTRVSGGPR